MLLSRRLPNRETENKRGRAETAETVRKEEQKAAGRAAQILKQLIQEARIQ